MTRYCSMVIRWRTSWWCNFRTTCKPAGTSGSTWRACFGDPAKLSSHPATSVPGMPGHIDREVVSCTESTINALNATLNVSEDVYSIWRVLCRKISERAISMWFMMFRKCFLSHDLWFYRIKSFKEAFWQYFVSKIFSLHIYDRFTSIIQTYDYYRLESFTAVLLSFMSLLIYVDINRTRIYYGCKIVQFLVSHI